MVGATGSRMMRLLKRTSEHHRPGRLAAAVALGVLIGLLPKANLLVVALYAALVLLPVHTLLGLMVSLLVGFAATKLDGVSHVLGSALLELPSLRPLWITLDNTAVLPWLQLHNTVVLGSFVMGIALLGPTFLLSLRVFEYATWGAVARPANRSGLQRTIVAEPFITQVAKAPMQDDEIDFEPVHLVTPIINDWHMGSAAKVRANMQPVGIEHWRRPRMLANEFRRPTSGSVSNSLSVYQPAVSFTSDTYRAEISNSVELAENASEVLAWVDELLEECVSEDASALTSENVAHVSRGSYRDDGEPFTANAQPPATGSEEQRWLLETTIEIVRWADEPMPRGQSADQISYVDAMIASATTSTCEFSVGDASSEPLCQGIGSDPDAPQVLRLHERSSENDREATMGFERLVLAGGQNTTVEQIAPSTAPRRAECLGFLLGHLRQSRDGRTS